MRDLGDLGDDVGLCLVWVGLACETLRNHFMGKRPMVIDTDTCFIWQHIGL